MSSSFRAKYLEALKDLGDWVIVSEWAQRFGELYPDLLEKADREAANQANETTGLREIAARISSAINHGAYENQIEIDTSERPRKVRFIPEKNREEHDIQEIEDDIAPLRRDEIIRISSLEFDNNEKYRVAEFEAISKQLKTFFGLDFEVDHAQALLNQDRSGKHHPDNLQLLLKSHNGRKNNGNWVRFSLEEQIQYIEAAIALQALVSSRLGIDMKQEVLKSLTERLKSIY
ncbi:MAG: HNH endonuclease [Gammaproteobacteria bacterium]|nr:HNH endonuclease [Gammaproteobacteria bacterium]